MYGLCYVSSWEQQRYLDIRSAYLIIENIYIAAFPFGIHNGWWYFTGIICNM